MTVSILNLHCLNAVCDDYENVESIRDEVRRSSHGNVTDREIVESLHELVREGMVQAAEVDSVTGEFITRGLMSDGLSGMWFVITPKGRVELDANWVES